MCKWGHSRKLHYGGVPASFLAAALPEARYRASDGVSCRCMVFYSKEA